MRSEAMLARRLPRSAVVAGFLAVALVLLPFADLAVARHDPWAALGRLAAGLLAPDPGALDRVGEALVLTLAVALAGVAAGAAAGFAAAPFYRLAPVRLVAVALRSVHELFWALLLMQVTGIGVATGIAAIALPYAGIFAKVFAEYLEETDRRPRAALPPGTPVLSAFLYTRLPLAWGEMKTYTLYRVECGLRSSAVLGFIGLPTLGFQLDSAFRQGQYGAVGAVLLLYFALIGTVRFWLRPVLLPLLLAGSAVVLAAVDSPPMGQGTLWRFLTVDIVPAPLRHGELTDPATWERFAGWLADLLAGQALPGLFATLVVAQLALVVAGAVALTGFPLLVPRLVGRAGAAVGHIVLVAGRSVPDYMLAYLLLQMFGPSMLPAVLALGLHNGAIVAHLLGRQANRLGTGLRADAPAGLDLYGWELVPRLFVPFLALSLYRWEIIVRESAIVGILGVATLGFHIDAAIAELRIDRVVLFLAVTALATLAIDALSQSLRARLGVAGLRLEGGGGLGGPVGR